MPNEFIKALNKDDAIETMRVIMAARKGNKAADKALRQKLVFNIKNGVTRTLLDAYGIEILIMNNKELRKRVLEKI